MLTFSRRDLGIAALLASSAVTLSACGNSQSNSSSASSSDGGSAGASGASKTVTDARGEVSIPEQAQRIAATDNRAFRTLENWGVKLVAAPLEIISLDSGYLKDDSVVNIGNHREPNLEKLVAANPDLVLNGHRYARHYDDIKALLPDAAIVDTDIDLKKDIGEELTRHITLLGETLGHEDKAQTLVEEFNDAVARVKDLYDPKQTVMGLITTGGAINYAAPVTGRAVGPLYPLLGLTPSSNVEGSSDHKGDDISVEAVADSNPDWIIVMDRDAAMIPEDAEYQPAHELVDNSEALAGVKAIKQAHVVYMPNNFYKTEDIQAYTEFLTTFADALENK